MDGGWDAGLERQGWNPGRGELGEELGLVSLRGEHEEEFGWRLERVCPELGGKPDGSRLSPGARGQEQV